MELLASLGEAMAKGGDKGKGNGKGALGGANGGAPKLKLCMWDTCIAAKKKQATWGGGPNCYCCKKQLSQPPPIERLVEWAYLEKFAAKKSKGDGKGKTGAGSTKGKGKGPKADLAATEEQLKELRTVRLEGLKAGVPPGGAAAAVTAVQEVAKVFDENKTALPWGEPLPAIPLKLEAELVEQVGKLTSTANQVVSSLQGEHYPSKKPLLSAKDTLAKLVQGVASCASVQTREAAERALAATSVAVTALMANGTPPADADLLQLVKRQERQKKEVERLIDKAPTVNLRRLALVEARDTYQKGLQAESDFAEKGRLKALQRAHDRLALVQTLGEVVAKLHEEAESQCAELQKLHGARTDLKTVLGQEVLDLIDLKIDALEEQMVVDEDFADAVDAGDHAASDPLTQAESERDALMVRLAKFKEAAATPPAPDDQLALAKAEIVKLQAALAEAAAGAAQVVAGGGGTDADLAAAPAAGGDPAADLWREFKADCDLLPKGPVHSAATVGVLQQLSAVFVAVPWGAPLPAMQFQTLGAPPHAVHTLLGDLIWKDCWKDQHEAITDAHYIPYKLLNILKWVTEQAQLSSTAEQLSWGVGRYEAVVKAATVRRRGGSPY